MVKIKGQRVTVIKIKIFFSERVKNFNKKAKVENNWEKISAVFRMNDKMIMMVDFFFRIRIHLGNK